MNISNRFVNIFRLALVLALSLLLLIFVGLGEARRTYPRFEIEKMAAQGELVQIAMSPFLLADLPLHQFPGFLTLTQPILDSTPSIDTIYVTNLKEEIPFSNTSSPLEDRNNAFDSLSQFQESSFQRENDRFTVTENEEFYQVNFDLEGRLETVGQLHIVMPKEIVEATINQKFLYVKIAAGILLGLYIGFLFQTRKKWLGDEETPSWEKGGIRLLGISYGISFFLIALLEIFMLLNIYVSGIEAKTRSLADSLGYRLDAAFSLGLSIDDFQGIDTVFDNYQELNPDLSFVALTSTDGKIIIHTDDQLLGTTWTSQSDLFEYDVLLDKGGLSTEGMSLHLGIPKKIVYNRLWRVARNFLTLFVASAFLTSIFFSLIRTLSNKPALTPGTLHTKRGYLMSLIGPLYFLSIFVTQGLSVAFLPQYFQEVATETGAIIDISTLFSLYFIAYAVALPITGSFIEKKGVKRFLILGSVLIVFALLLLSFTRVFYLLFVIQGILGFGEGMFFIAVQSYILNVAPQKDRTKGATIIVNSLYGGLLSGTAIGALLVTDPAFGQRGVFILGSMIAVFMLLYVLYLVPKISGENFKENEQDDVRPVVEDTLILKRSDMHVRNPFFSIFRDFEFIAIALLVGIPVKIVWAGLFKASFPLILERYHYPTEDVGQIMMLYAAGVLISSAFISRIVAKTGKTNIVLAVGTVGSGVGLVLIGLMGWEAIAQSGAMYLTTIALILGMSVLGLAHGFIQAPIITHVSNTKTANRLGKSSAVSLYRLLERVGNIGGPILIGALLLKSDYNAITITWIGAVVILFGILYFVGFQKRKKI